MCGLGYSPSIEGQKPSSNTTNNANNPTPSNITNSTTGANSKAPLRRISNSSLESAHSNRTDISTVVNASMSMHNTAPASPDPDGSEISDSTISDNDEAPEGTAGYAPKPGEIGSQSRWRHGSEQPSRLQQSDASVVPGSAQQVPNEGGGGPLSRKTFIQMVKEQFPKQQNQQQQPHGGNEPVHHHMAPQPQQQSRYPYGHNQQQQHHGGPPPPRYGGNHHHPMHQQHPDYQPPPSRHHYDHPSYPHHVGPPANNSYDRMGMQQQPGYGYPPSRHQQHPPPQSHRFKPPTPHAKYPPPQQQQLPHDSPDFPIHGINHMKARVNNIGGGPIVGAPHPSTLGGPPPHAIRHHSPMNPHNIRSPYMQSSPQPRPPYMQQQQPLPGSTPRPPISMGNALPPHEFFHGEPQHPPLPLQVAQPPAGPGSAIGPQQQQQQPPPTSNQQQQMIPVTTTSHHQQQQQHLSLQQPPTSTAMTDVSFFF